MGSVTTAEASRRLGVHPATVANMIEDGRLLGERGQQPKRPRWRVCVDDHGHLLNKDGRPVPEGAPFDAAFVADLERRVRALEEGVRTAAPSRDAMLLLNATLERQREAMALQTRAVEILNEALAEQGRIISTLLVPDSAPS